MRFQEDRVKIRCPSCKNLECGGVVIRQLDSVSRQNATTEIVTFPGQRRPQKLRRNMFLSISKGTAKNACVDMSVGAGMGVNMLHMGATSLMMPADRRMNETN